MKRRCHYCPNVPTHRAIVPGQRGYRYACGGHTLRLRGYLLQLGQPGTLETLAK